MRLSGHVSERARPWDKTTNAIPDRASCLSPIYLTSRFFDLRRVARAFGELRTRHGPSCNIIRNRAKEEFSTDARKPIVKYLSVVILANRSGFLRENRPRVHACIHFHDCDAGFMFIVQD